MADFIRTRRFNRSWTGGGTGGVGPATRFTGLKDLLMKSSIAGFAAKRSGTGAQVRNPTEEYSDSVEGVPEAVAQKIGAFLAAPKDSTAISLSRRVMRHPIMRRLGKKRSPGTKRQRRALKNVLGKLAAKGDISAAAALGVSSASGKPHVGLARMFRGR